MKNIKYIFILLIGLFLTACSKNPDVVYVNGKIYTLDKSNTIVEALAIKDGKILETGKSEDLKNKYKSTKTIDLNGNSVLPGLIDSDGNIVEFSLELARYQNLVDLRNVTTLEQIKKLLGEKCKTAKPDTWVGAYGWNEDLLEADIDEVNKSLLDEVSKTQNIYIINIDGSMVWGNSKLFETLQITNLTPSPSNGEIDKDKKGEPTGLLFGDAINLVKEKLPKFTKEDMLSSLEAGTKELLKYGITEVRDRNVNKESINIFKQLIDSNKFYVKVNAVLTGSDESFEEFLKKGIESDYKDMMFIKSVTLDYDGAFDLQSASMKEDYKTEPKRREPYTNETQIENVLKKALEKNLQFSIKAIGDNAVDKVLNVLEKVDKEKSIKENRIIIEGMEFVDNNDIDKIKNLKIIPLVKPESNIFDAEFLDSKISSANNKNFAIWKTINEKAGVMLSGSGFPFSRAINPFVNVFYLVTRQQVDTNITMIPNPEQKLSILDAIKTFTVNSAFASFQENTKGTLEKGKFADLIVISNDIFNIEPKKLLDTKVLKTIVNGKEVFSLSN